MCRILTVPLELDEFRLLTAAKAGHKDAYGGLIGRHQEAVFHAAYLLTGSPVQARTVTLQAFVQAWPMLRRLPSDAPFRGWIVSLAAREAIGAPRGGAWRATARRIRDQAHHGIELQHRLTADHGVDRVPAAPDLTTAAMAALGERRTHRRRPISTAAAAFAVVVLSLALADPALRSGARRQRSGSAPGVPLTPLAGAERFPLGQRIPLRRARSAASFTALMPPRFDEAYLGQDVPGGRVSVFAGRVLITEFRGAILPDILTLIGPGTHAQLTWVNGRPGVYGSSVHASEPGDVLTWLQGPLTVRIEGARTLEQALALARRLG